MAGTTKVTQVRRPLANATDANGNTACTVPAAFLEVTFDRYSNGLQVQTVPVAFSDYEGLEDEWVAGTATTVLAAAVLAVLALIAWEATTLTTAQRSYLSIAIALGD